MTKTTNKSKAVFQQVAPINGVKHKTSKAYREEEIRPKDSDGTLGEKYQHYFMPDASTYSELDGLRQKVFLDRYADKGIDGSALETHPEQMWARVANGIAEMEKTPALKKEWAEKFYNTMKGFKFVPGGRILSGAGTGYQVTFFNCYVIPSPKDSRRGIMENIMHTVEIQSRAGGVGVNLSSLRPSGARVRKVNGTSSGPVNWASLYSTANHDVIQQGGSRRGALMLMLHDWHPDVLEFIHVKEDLTKIPGANLSVCVSDKFMEAVENDGEWTTRFPDHTDPEYDQLWDGDIEKWEALGKPVKIYGTHKARDIWDQICNAAWRSAEPGLHFLERSNKWSNTWYFEKLLSTNPCGEQPLGAWAVCNLGAMNLSAYVSDDGVFNYDGLDKDVRVAMRFMDNVVDANYYFYEVNEVKAKEIRRTGIGTMGLGDTLIKMKLPYGSAESLVEIEKIYKIIRDAAYEVSSDLAKEKGSFPMFDAEKFAQGHFIQNLPTELQAKIKKQGIRNAVILTQAPTGTTSLVAGVSSGIEPVYDFEMKRKDRIGEHIIYHPLYEKWLKDNPGVSEKPAYFVSANDLTPDDHVKIQALIQHYTDSSISKTVNAPNAHTVEDVSKLYMDAYKLGCKGVTYFRDGSRTGVLSHIDEKKSDAKADAAPLPTFAHRPMALSGRTYEIMTPMGRAYITVNHDEMNQPFEVFVNIAKGGTHTLADAEAIGRLISLTLRGTSSEKRMEVAAKIVAQLRNIGGSSSVGFGKNRIMSLADAIAKILADDISITTLSSENQTQAEVLPLDLAVESTESGPDGFSLAPSQTSPTKHGDICTECGNATLVNEEGCMKCYSCGYSKC